MAPKKNIFLRCTPLLVCILFILQASCVKDKLNKRLAHHEIEQLATQTAFEGNVFSTDSTPMKWNQAVDFVLANNVQYRNAIESTAQVSRRRTKLYTDLAPRVFAFLNLNTSLDKLANISSEDIQLNIIANISIPNPIQFYVQLYGVALQEIQTRLNLELQRRQLISNLYLHFLRFRTYETQEEELRIQEKQLTYTGIDKLYRKIEAIERRKQELRRSRESLRLSANAILDTPGRNWQFTGKLPKVSYAKKLDQLDFKKGYAVLGLKLQSLQVEAALLSLWGVKIARLPNLSLGMTTPQLYSYESDENFQFEGEDYRMFAGLSKSLEFDDIFDKEKLRQAEFRAEASNKQLAHKMENEISKLLSNKMVYRLVSNTRKQLLREKSLILNSDANSSATQITQDLNYLKSLRKKIDSLDKQLLLLDLQFWIWDDKYWNK